MVRVATLQLNGFSIWNTAAARDSGTADATEMTTVSPPRTIVKLIVLNRLESVSSFNN